MPKQIVGSDFDGTYSDHNELHGKVDFLCTGESWERYEEMMFEVEGPDIPIFFNPAPADNLDLMNIVSHKALVINGTKATKYYENEKVQANILKVMCPNCKIILVKDDEEVTK